MITEKCTDGAINITKTCIRGFGFYETNILISFFILSIIILLSILTKELLFRGNKNESRTT